MNRRRFIKSRRRRLEPVAPAHSTSARCRALGSDAQEDPGARRHQFPRARRGPGGRDRRTQRHAVQSGDHQCRSSSAPREARGGSGAPRPPTRTGQRSASRRWDAVIDVWPSDPVSRRAAAMRLRDQTVALSVRLVHRDLRPAWFCAAKPHRRRASRTVGTGATSLRSGESRERAAASRRSSVTGSRSCARGRSRGTGTTRRTCWRGWRGPPGRPPHRSRAAVTTTCRWWTSGTWPNSSSWRSSGRCTGPTT